MNPDINIVISYRFVDKVIGGMKDENGPLLRRIRLLQLSIINHFQRSLLAFCKSILAKTLNSKGNKFSNISEHYVLMNIFKSTVIQNTLINVFMRIKLTSNTGGCFVCSW